MSARHPVAGALAAVCLFVLGMVAVGPTAASAESCGLVVTGNYTLTGPVSGCTGVPITVQGDNLTLDLGGFSVSCVKGVSGEGPGIYVPSRHNVTIRNGTVQYCDNGVYLEGGGGHTLTNLNLVDNVGPLDGQGIFGEGIQLFESSGNQIMSNRVLGNGPFSGINLYDSNRNLVAGNVVDSNNVLETAATSGPIMQDIGIWVVWLGQGASQNTVSNNQVTNNGLDGVQLSTNSTGNTVQSNLIARNGCGQVPGIRNGDGIAVFGQQSLIQGNQVLQNCGNGIYVRGGRDNHRILSNQTVTNNTKAGPTPQFDLQDGNTSCDSNVWQGNTGGTRNQACIH